MARALLDNACAPITFTIGFVEKPFKEFSDAFVSWRREIDTKFGTQTLISHSSAPLLDALLSLQPLTTPSDRCLLIETRSPWSAIFSNGLRVNDVASPVGHLPTILKCRGLHVTCIPDRGHRAPNDGVQTWGAVTFTLNGPEKTDWLNRIRHIAVTNDVGGWEFVAEGEVQPYEKTENYQKRKIVERFTPEMLESYCAALGIELFNTNFYGGQYLVSHIKRATQPGPSMSIAEAHRHLYL